MILSGLSQSRHLVCDSEATRQDVLRLVAIPQSRVSKVYLTINYPYSPMSSEDIQVHLRALGVNHQPFVLHVGGNQWYKNRLGAIQIFNSLLQYEAFRECRLLMVGRPWTDEMRQFVCRSGLSERVLELTDVDEEPLRALYSCAELLLFPSWEEGFGWPILEAQACGCPVVTTDKAPMSEISGAASILINPADPTAAAAKIAATSNLPSFREAGLQNVARFSRSAMTTQYLEIYRQLLQ
jgi:glycosyltransferase involved in cell wall biosynthesis